MYAIIESGSKQYKIEEGDVIDVELLESKDKNVQFKNVLLVQTNEGLLVGSPHVEKAVVEAQILEEVKGPKVVSFKYKKRKSQKVKQGHRQKYTRVKINKINASKGA